MKIKIEDGQILLAISEKEFRTLNRMVCVYIGTRLEDGVKYRHIDPDSLQMHSDFNEQERTLNRLLKSLKRRKQTLKNPIVPTMLF